MQHPAVVVIIHEDERMASTIAEEIQAAGLVAVAAARDRLMNAPEEAIALFARHEPRVVVYDVSPHDESIRFLSFLAGSRAGAPCTFVLTTTEAHEHEPLLREAIDLCHCPHAIPELVAKVMRVAA